MCNYWQNETFQAAICWKNSVLSRIIWTTKIKFFWKTFLFTKKKVNKAPTGIRPTWVWHRLKFLVFYFVRQWLRPRKKVKIKIKNQSVNNKDLSKSWQNTSCLALQRRFGEIIDVHHNEKGTAVQAFNLELFLLYKLLCMLYVKCHNFPTQKFFKFWLAMKLFWLLSDQICSKMFFTKYVSLVKSEKWNIFWKIVIFYKKRQQKEINWICTYHH